MQSFLDHTIGEQVLHQALLELLSSLYNLRVDVPEIADEPVDTPMDEPMDYGGDMDYGDDW